MRLRAILATVAIFAVSACDSRADTPAPASGAVPTAAPFPTVPEPTIVTGPVTATPSAAPSATPDSGPAAAGAATTGEQIYTVVAGDVLGLIADRFDVPSAQIRALNNLTGDAIQIGQRLRIPARAAGSPATAPPPAAAPGNGVTTHIVKAGDTASGIALQYDTTVAALERANGVAAGGLNNLQLGQVVKLAPPGGR